MARGATKPLALSNTDMENEKPVTVISPSQPIVVTPPSREVITVRPIQREAVVIKPASVVLIEPKAVEVMTIQPSRAVTVQPPERGAWDERGWTRIVNGNREIYEGYYMVGRRRFRGRIETRTRGRNVRAYIYNPPPEIKRHPHGACFQFVNDDWFYLHWARPARNVDDAILYMERVLDESING